MHDKKLLREFAMRILELNIETWKDARFELAWIRMGAKGKPGRIEFPLRPDLTV